MLKLLNFIFPFINLLSWHILKVKQDFEMIFEILKQLKYSIDNKYSDI